MKSTITEGQPPLAQKEDFSQLVVDAITDPDTRAMHIGRLKKMGFRDEAEDLVQTAYMKAYAARARYDSRSQVRTWLFEIIRNTMIDYLRGRHDETFIDDCFSGIPHPCSPPMAERQYAAREEIGLLYSTLDASLSDPVREGLETIFHVYFERDVSYTTIASASHIPQMTVIGRARRARTAALAIKSDLEK